MNLFKSQCFSRWMARGVLLGLVVTLTGCLATRQEIEDLRADIVRLQTTLSSLENTQKKGQKGLQGSQADVLYQTATLSRNIEILTAQLEESENRMTLMATRMDDLDSNLSNRLDLLSEMLSGSKLAASPSPSTLFGLAYSDFARRRYDQAIKGFKTYLEKYGETEKAAEAQFNIGECYFVQKEWSRALKAYDRVLAKYPKSSIVPTAYLQKALTLENMDKAKESAAIFETIVKKYPHRREARVAQGRLDALKNETAPSESPAPSAP